MRHEVGFPGMRRLTAIVFGLIFLSASVTPRAELPRLDLTGVVKSAGHAVEGAHVFIYTAGPRVGPGDI